MTDQAPKVSIGFEQQVDEAKKQAEARGFGGAAHIDAHPKTGLIRIKVNLIPEEKRAQFIEQYINVLTMSLTAMNIQVSVYTDPGED